VVASSDKTKTQLKVSLVQLGSRVLAYGLSNKLDKCPCWPSSHALSQILELIATSDHHIGGVLEGGTRSKQEPTDCKSETYNMHPLAARNEFTEEGSSLARTSSTADAVVLDITASSGTHRLAVVVPQREAPNAITSMHASMLDLLPQDLRVGEHTTGRLIQRLAHVPRAGANVNDALGTEVLAIQEHGRRLHERVVPAVLSSANVERKGLGMTKVSFRPDF